MVLTDNIKKIMLAGIGTIASTAEKSKDLLQDMVKKGELTVDQADILNGDFAKMLKQKSQIVKEKSQDLRESIQKKISKKYSDNDFSDLISSLDEDQLSALKEQISSYEEAVEAGDFFDEAGACDGAAEPVLSEEAATFVPDEEPVEEAVEEAAEEAAEEDDDIIEDAVDPAE